MVSCRPEGRSSSEWVDFNFYGHQIVAHLAPTNVATATPVPSTAINIFCSATGAIPSRPSGEVPPPV
jgi:extradiol dioxygenase family protein